MKDTVLIVDEDVNARIIAEVLLQSRGLAARLANDGSDACEILRCHGSSIMVVVVGVLPVSVHSLIFPVLRSVATEATETKRGMRGVRAG